MDESAASSSLTTQSDFNNGSGGKSSAYHGIHLYVYCLFNVFNYL